MATCIVRFADAVSISVAVETEKIYLDDIAEMAYEELPGELCAHCSGWGYPWTRELSHQEEVVTTKGRPAVEKGGEDCLGPDCIEGEEST